MTASLPTSAHSRSSRLPGIRRLRAATWMLHVLVSLLAVFSLFTNRFHFWIDLRMLGSLGTLIVEVVWLGPTLLVPLCAGPRLAGLVRPHWIHPGFAPQWALRFLWPTYLILVCLVANTVYFYHLVWIGRMSFSVPMPVVVALLLGAWVLLTREWIRSSATLRESVPIRRTMQWLAGAFAAAATLLAACLAMVFLYARPPRGPVDLAVVLGYGVRPDGTASVVLADRTRVAIDLFHRGLIKHILLSGGISDAAAPGLPERNEAVAMRQVCLDSGIPDDAISLDPVGVNTRATAYNTRLFMRDHHYSSVVACSSDFHLYRTTLSFREVGIDAATLPAQPTDWLCPDPRDTLRELIGIVVYWIDPHYRQPKAAEMNLHDPHLLVRKTAGTLELYDGPNLVKTYPCITGTNPGDKTIEGDRKTPLGTFHIVYKNAQSKFHLSLGLDYPAQDDAARGLASGLITRQQYDDILAALHSDLTREENQKKLWYTPLGGEIFLHGFGTGRTATAGCIALSNLDIEELYAVLPLGTPVEIRP